MEKNTLTEGDVLKLFTKENRFLSCNITSNSHKLNILHRLKDKGLVRFKGNQNELQFFELVK